jgi:hypothetical protein
VRIHARPTPYKEKFVINRIGGVGKPIRVCGVPDPVTGAKPIIDGINAVTRANQLYRSAGGSSTMAEYGTILVDGTAFGVKPKYIDIDGLDVRGGSGYVNGPDSFYDTVGQLRTYVEGAGCIFIQKGDYVNVRNNELSGCDNGIFVKSNEYGGTAPYSSEMSDDVLIDGNYIHDTGVPGGPSVDRYHDSYIEAYHVTYQYNRYGPQKPGAGGSALKDRSIGTVIRYNHIDGCARALDLVEAEDFSTTAMNSPEYRETFVYGNIITHGPNSGIAIHYGGDHYGGGATGYGESTFRKGTLYFYDNTLVLTADIWNGNPFTGTFFQLSTTQETAEIFNNVLWVKQNPSHVSLCADTGGIGSLWQTGGTFHLGKNVINGNWSLDPDGFGNHICSGIVSGNANMIGTASDPIDFTSFQLIPAAPGIDAAQPTSSFPSLGAYPANMEYDYDHLKGQTRPVLGAGVDIGALESH